MKQTNLLLKVAFFLLIFCALTSCDSEGRNIKKALKESALENGTKYKFTKYKIVETILRTNIEDSIKSGNVSILVQKKMMRLDSVILNQYFGEREQCKIQKRNTVWHLASAYDNLIEDWQKMIDKQEEKLKLKQEEIDKIEDANRIWKSLIENTDSAIIYYVIKHQYVLDGKHIEENILLTTEFETI